MVGSLDSTARTLAVLGLTAAALLAGSVDPVSAQGRGQEQGPPVARYRASLMNAAQAQQGALRLLLAGEVAEPGHVALHARAMHESFEMMTGTFPEGSGGTGTRAQPAIWENWSDFAAKLEEAKGAAARLSAAADAGDMAAAGAALREVGQSCRGCHMEYRAREAIGGGS